MRWTQRAHLPQPGMLGLGPDGHLGSARGDEHERGERPGGRCEQSPAVYLKGVVGAGDVVKAKAARDGVALAARRPEVPLDDVRPAWTAQGSQSLLTIAVSMKAEFAALQTAAEPFLPGSLRCVACIVNTLLVKSALTAKLCI